MSVLSDKDIVEEIFLGNLGITPFYNSRLQPASYDLTLGVHFKRLLNPTKHQSDDGYWREGAASLDLREPQESQWTAFSSRDTMGQGLVLEPRDFYLASTVEKISLPRNIMARVEGKSSLGRSGLMMHVTAGFVDPGFGGEITLEMKNISGRPLIIYPGMPCAQIAFEYMSSPATEGYRGKYQDQSGPQISQFHKNYRQEGWL